MAVRALLTGLLALLLLTVVPSYDRVFDSLGWRVMPLAAAATALLLAAVLHHLRIPTVLAAALSAAAALVFLPWGLSVGPGWWPEPGEQWAALRTLVDDALHVIATEPSPAPAVVPLVAIVALGWWVIAHLAYDLTVRARAPGAGLTVVTALWAVPLAIPTDGADDGWRVLVPFLAAAATLLLAGSATRDRPVSRTPLPAAGVALASVAIVAAVVVPGFLPGHDTSAWWSPPGRDGPRGYQPIVDVSSRLNAPQERDVLHVRSTERTYLRLAGLDGFDGQRWQLGDPERGTWRPPPSSLTSADQRLPAEAPAANTQQVETDIEVLELENIYVPLPYQPVEVFGPVRDELVWSTAGGFMATWDGADTVGDRIGIRQGTTYRAVAEQPRPSYEQLTAVEVPEDVSDAYTALPNDYPALEEHAQRIYDDAGATTMVDRALALQDWFAGPAGGFTYDLGVPALPDDQALVDFVLEDRVGYCEYFATAMAVMLRATGIPARVAVGFLPGELVAEADRDAGERFDEYRVTSGDAHAWVEVLFPGYGWIAFEPTPRDDGAELRPSSDELLPRQNERERAEREDLDGPDDEPSTDDPESPESPDQDARDDEATETEPEEQEQATGAASDGSAGPGMALLIGIGVLAGLALLAWRWSWRDANDEEVGPRARVLTAQQRLLRTAHGLGIERRQPETIHEALERWSAEGRIAPAAPEAGATAQAAAFGGPVSDEAAVSAVATLERARREMTERVAWRERLRAPLRRMHRRLHATWHRR